MMNILDGGWFDQGWSLILRVRSLDGRMELINATDVNWKGFLFLCIPCQEYIPGEMARGQTDIVLISIPLMGRG